MMISCYEGLIEVFIKLKTFILIYFIKKAKGWPGRSLDGLVSPEPAWPALIFDGLGLIIFWA